MIVAVSCLGLIIVIITIVICINHSEDKRQKTSGHLYPLPPPSLCCIFATSYYQSIGVLYVSSIGVWVLSVSSSYLSNMLLVENDLYYLWEVVRFRRDFEKL